MKKNIDKIIAIGVVGSVFLGIGGYSLGMTYARSLDKTYMENILKSKSNQDMNISMPSDSNSNNDSNNMNTSSNSNDATSSSNSKTTSTKSNISKNKKSSSNTFNSSSRGYRSTSSPSSLRINSSRSGSTSKNNAPSKFTASIPNKLKDGVYEGSAYGYQSDVKVKVTVKGGKINDIEIVSQNETPGFFEKGQGVISKILGSQNVNVDAISGATFTSNAIKKAVSNALSKAGASVDSNKKIIVPSSNNDNQNKELAKLRSENEKLKKENAELKNSSQLAIDLANTKLKDGSYEGKATGFKSDITVKVDVVDGKISNIDILSNGDDAEYFNKAKVLTSKIVEKNSIDVDAITGATFSSNGIKNAVRNALAQAGLKVSNSSNPELESLLAKATQRIEEMTKENTSLKESVNSLNSQLLSGGSLNVSSLKDGTFTGSSKGYKSTVNAEVTISGGKITSINVNSDDDRPYFEKAKSLISNIIDRQNPNVDTVSGATFSSNGIKGAIINALTKAKSSPEASKSDESNSLDTQINNYKSIIETLRNELKKAQDTISRLTSKDNSSANTSSSDSNTNSESVNSMIPTDSNSESTLESNTLNNSLSSTSGNTTDNVYSSSSSTNDAPVVLGSMRSLNPSHNSTELVREVENNGNGPHIITKLESLSSLH